MKNKYVRRFNEQKKSVKCFVIFLIFLLLLILFFLVAFCVGSFLSAIESILGNDNSIWYYALKSKQGKPITFAVYFIMLFFIALSSVKTYQNKIKASDERGVHFMEDNTYGSSRWMQKEEIKDAFEVANINDTVTTIYGQLTKDGESVVGWKPSEIGGTGNRNVIVLASMGSGKSFGYVRTELIQAILRGDSFVVTDPSAELYTDISKFAKSKGVDVRVLNLADPSYSEFWNCIEETIDPQTERLDSTRLNDFAAIYMKNSGDQDVPFWYNSAQNLLKAVIGYTAYKAELSVLSSYLMLYKKVSGGKNTEDNITKTFRNSFVSFPWCREVILKTASQNHFDEDEVKRAFLDIENIKKTSAFTIGEVFNNLLIFPKICDEFDNIPDFHPAKIAYITYQTNDTDAVRKSALQAIQLRFQLFTDNKLKEVLSHDGIHLSDITMHQSAYFVIMSDKSNATRPIASLFFSFLFKDVQDIYDKNQQIAKEQGIKNPCLDLVAMLDEFFSIGVIGGTPDSFGITMSNSRKRHIYISIIVQVYSQIEALYGRQIRDVIQGGCSTLLYLGGNDPSSCQFISEFASGEATVLSESHKSEAGILRKNTASDITVKSDKRFLLTVDEARRWRNKVLVVKQGEYPLMLNPFPWTEHPVYKKGIAKPTSIYSNIEPLSLRLTKLSNESFMSLDVKSIAYKSIEKLRPYMVDFDTGEILEEKSDYIPEDFRLFDERKKDQKAKVSKDKRIESKYKKETTDSIISD